MTLGNAGRVAVLSGTGWQTADAKAAWHRGGALASHTVSLGAHVDRYTLVNPTFNTTDWTASNPVTTTVASRGDGKTQTSALWAQDSWRITPTVRLTVGGRYEQWKGYDGLNLNGSTTVVQRTVDAARFSPKGTLVWTPSDWQLSASVGKAYRFATAAELYQLVTTGATFTSPDPTLKPDNVLATELRVERAFGKSRVQLSLFNDDVHDAIISQFKPLVAGSNTFFSYLSNVDHVRARGAELVLSERDVLIPGSNSREARPISTREHWRRRDARARRRRRTQPLASGSPTFRIGVHILWRRTGRSPDWRSRLAVDTAAPSPPRSTTPT